MKYCSRGKHEAAKELFSKSSKTKDGLQRWCKPCLAIYERDRYQNGDRERKERNRAKSVAKARQYIWNMLTSSKCVDCGEADPLVLEFDHRDQVDKLMHISEMFYHSIENIQKEIDKCDIRCANCHRRRTIRQLGTWRGIMIEK